MKLSDLDTVIDRRGTGCLKYDFAVQRGKPADVLPFWVADMDFKVAEPILDALRKRVDHGIFGYSESGESYFEALKNWQKENYGWDIEPEWLIKTPGVVPAINLAVKALTKEGDGILINRPVYYPFLEAIRKNGRKLVNSPLILKNDHYELDFDDLEAKIKAENVKLALLCSPHNPVGRVWTKEELSRYADICIRNGVKIVADEIHEDFTYPGFTHTTFATISKEAAQNAIICTAPSKTFNIAGLQTSNILIPNPEIRKAFQDALDSFGYDQLNTMGLVACEAAYSYGREWLDTVKEYIRLNVDFTRDYLKENLPKMKLIEPEGTYLLWIDAYAYGLSDEDLEHKVFYDCHLWLDMGYIFGPEGNGFLRFNPACPRETLIKGLTLLKEGFEGKDGDKFKTMVTVSGVTESIGEKLHLPVWIYDPSKVTIPVFMAAGTGILDRKLITPLDEMKDNYSKIQSKTAAMGRRKDADHLDIQTAADAYITAWLRWQLDDDIYAKRVFTGKAPEILRNPAWDNAEVRNPETTQPKQTEK